MRYVRLKLDRERRLRFTIEALESLEARGYNVRNALLGEKRITSTVLLIFEGLRWDDSKQQGGTGDLTLEKTRALLQIAADNGTPLQTFYDLAVEALTKSGIFQSDEISSPLAAVAEDVDAAARPEEPALMTS